MTYQVSDFWLNKHFQPCDPSYGGGLKSNQEVISYSQNVCTAITPMYHSDGPQL